MPDISADNLEPAKVTLDDLRSAGVNAVLDQPSTVDYTAMNTSLNKAADEAKAAGDEAKARALGFMAAICSMMLTPSEKAAPFQPMLVIGGRRTMIPDDLSQADIDLLGSFCAEVKNDLLRARLADLVWMKDRRKGIGFARTAIDGYRTHPIDADTWHISGQAVWHRALQLAISIGAGAENRATEIESTLLGAFDNAHGADGIEPLWYVRPLFVEKRARPEASRIAGEFERIGRERLAAGNGFAAESFFQEAERWFERAHLPEKQAGVLAMLASSYADLAEASGSAIARQEFITRAIATYRQVPGQYRAEHKVEETIDTLRAKLAAAGRLALGEMKLIKGPTIDLTKFVEQSMRAVTGKTPLDALLAFCALHPFPNRQKLYDAAKNLVSQSLVGRLFGGATLAEDGRVIARRGGADNGAEAEAAQIEARAVKSCVELAAMTAHGMIIPALDAMQMESHLTPLDFANLAYSASFVPNDRADVVAKGLYAGYCGDYVQAIHILMPQFEHMVRVALQNVGAHTTTHDKDGIDMETGLSTLVEREQMAAVFGEDLTFTIRSIMCEQEGPNLRNAVAHGLADSGLCNGQLGVYAWWLVLRLVVWSYMAAMQGPDPEGVAPSK
ncbi:DUF4209 domain-containing protein [Massilia horti]|uniref:DUF4209 domain-containing protein n=1 Tax=Massilia horti TaxID=2562153 RepID=A0A4Y9SZ68_9BURK|nr:DUF4209 domain-containing protein [Massilia horti]TFW31755.1 DUF4209 domain-containing protein [Massilia horti]